MVVVGQVRDASAQFLLVAPEFGERRICRLGDQTQALDLLLAATDLGHAGQPAAELRASPAGMAADHRAAAIDDAAVERHHAHSTHVAACHIHVVDDERVAHRVDHGRLDRFVVLEQFRGEAHHTGLPRHHQRLTLRTPRREFVERQEGRPARSVAAQPGDAPVRHLVVGDDDAVHASTHRVGERLLVRLVLGSAQFAERAQDALDLA